MYSTDTDVSNVDLPNRLELYGAEVGRHLDRDRRSFLGQYFTPAPIARFMASMLSVPEERQVRLLDPGAGIGILFAACVENLCNREVPPTHISIVAYELEPLFIKYLEDTINVTCPQ